MEIHIQIPALTEKARHGVVSLQSQHRRDGNREVSGTRWPVSHAESVTPDPSERICLIKWMAPKLDLWPPHTCEKAHTCFLSGREGKRER